jgi:hypothetical protein
LNTSAPAARRKRSLWSRIKAQGVYHLHRNAKRWNELGLFLSNNVARVIYALPVAGYVILYSDYFRVRFFNFANLKGSSWGFLSFDLRITLIYWGSWLLLLAYAIYRLKSPLLLRGKRDLHQFVTDVVLSRDRTTVIRASESPFFPRGSYSITFPHTVAPDEYQRVRDHLEKRGKDLGTGAGEYEDIIPSMLSMYYKFENIQKPYTRALITALAYAGYTMVLVLPAIDLALRVIGTHYRNLIG